LVHLSFYFVFDFLEALVWRRFSEKELGETEELSKEFFLIEASTELLPEKRK